MKVDILRLAPPPVPAYRYAVTLDASWHELAELSAFLNGLHSPGSHLPSNGPPNCPVCDLASKLRTYLRDR